MKKMLAIATVAALFGGGSAFAADSGAMRLDDAQLDGFTAGAKTINYTNTNYVIIAPITNVDLNNIAIGPNAQAITTLEINNIIYVVQYIGGGAGGGGGNAYGHLKQANKPIPPGQAKKLG